MKVNTFPPEAFGKLKLISAPAPSFVQIDPVIGAVNAFGVVVCAVTVGNGLSQLAATELIATNACPATGGAANDIDTSDPVVLRLSAFWYVAATPLSPAIDS
jgi:hypothetical protein